MKTMIIVPTYNESANIGPLLDEILALGTGAHVLVVDDDSPDGTWKIVQQYAERNPEVHLLHRKTDRGRGLAGIAGYRQALAWGAECVIEMDADFSHQPRYLPELMRAAEAADLVIGSRYVAGGRDASRGPLRQWISRAANAYIRIVFGLTVRDCSSGYRAYRSAALAAIRPDKLQTWGPAVLSDVLWRARLLRLRIAEVPIEFIDRQRGQSTLTTRVLLEGLWNVLRVRWSTRLADLQRA